MPSPVFFIAYDSPAFCFLHSCSESLQTGRAYVQTCRASVSPGCADEDCGVHDEAMQCLCLQKTLYNLLQCGQAALFFHYLCRMKTVDDTSRLLGMIEQGEHDMQDFKFEISDACKIARSISAFANTRGGRLLIGVKDNGKVAGVRSDEEIYMIEAAAQVYCTPSPSLAMETVTACGRKVVIATIEKSDSVPVYAISEDKKKLAYVRIADENILASVVRLAVWRQEKSNVGGTVHFGGAEKKMLDLLGTGEALSLNACARAAGVSRSAGADIMARFIRFGLAEEVLDGHKFFYRCMQAQPDDNCR